MPRSGKLPVLNLLTGQKSGFFAPHRRLVASIHVTLGRADGHLGPLGCAKFHLSLTSGYFAQTVEYIDVSAQQFGLCRETQNVHKTLLSLVRRFINRPIVSLPSADSKCRSSYR